MTDPWGFLMCFYILGWGSILNYHPSYPWDSYIFYQHGKLVCMVNVHIYIYIYQSHGSYGMVHKSPSSHFCGCLFETLGNIWNKLPTANGAGFLPSRVVKFFFSPKTNMSSVKIVLGRRPFPVEMAEMAPFVEETVSFHGCILICRDFVWFCLELPSLSWLRWSWFSEGYDGWIFFTRILRMGEKGLARYILVKGWDSSIFCWRLPWFCGRILSSCPKGSNQFVEESCFIYYPFSNSSWVFQPSFCMGDFGCSFGIV